MFGMRSVSIVTSLVRQGRSGRFARVFSTKPSAQCLGLAQATAQDWQYSYDVIDRNDRLGGVDDHHFHSQLQDLVPQSHEDDFLSVTRDSVKKECYLPPAVFNSFQSHANIQHDRPLYVVDLDDVRMKVRQWMALFPRVKPFYAVKCNPDVEVLRVLASMDVNFDCASSAEIQQVLDLGVSPRRIIYANPCKQVSHIQFAASRGIEYTTFDCVEELVKLRHHFPNARPLLRIAVDDRDAKCRFSQKFGARLEDVPEILDVAQSLGVDVRGVAFHVGSGCTNEIAYVKAVEDARLVFDYAASVGMDFDILDIGGGFPGDVFAPLDINDIARVLAKRLDELFPESSGVRLISEPGRYFASSSHTLGVVVIGKKLVGDHGQRTSTSVPAKKDPSAAVHTRGLLGGRTITTDVAPPPTYSYYVNDGVYGSFNNVIFDHAEFNPSMLVAKPEANGNGVGAVAVRRLADSTQQKSLSSVWGPTCDGFDCLAKDTWLPELNVGDWLYFPAMGAYTSAASSNFNGFVSPSKVYVDSCAAEADE